MNPGAHEENMHGTASSWHGVLPGTVVETAKHHECLALFQLGINDPGISIGAKVRPFITPEVGAWHDPRRAVGLEGVASGYEQAEQHVPAFAVLFGFRVPGMVVLVVPMQFLRLTAWAGVHRDRNRK